MNQLSLAMCLLVVSMGNGACQTKTPITASGPTIPVEKVVATEDQLARRRQSEAICRAHQVPYYKNQTAMFTGAEKGVQLRTQDEVVDRALALCYVVLKSTGLDSSRLDKMANDYHVLPKLSPREKNYLQATHPTDQQHTDAGWNSESLHVMLWALGLIDSLAYPNSVCPATADLVLIHGLTESQFRQKSRLRSKKEILDQADLILRLDWAGTEARLKHQPAPGFLNTDVILERHRSLNWLINYMQQAWDDVSTDT